MNRNNLFQNYSKEYDPDFGNNSEESDDENINS